MDCKICHCCSNILIIERKFWEIEGQQRERGYVEKNLYEKKVQKIKIKTLIAISFPFSTFHQYWSSTPIDSNTH